MNNRIFYSLVFGVFAIGSLLVFQMTRKTASAVYLPSQLASQSKPTDIARIRVAGRVADLPIEYRVQPEIELKFSIVDAGADSITTDSLDADSGAFYSGASATKVVYKRLKPDMFAVGRDVIIDGEFKDGVIIAHQLLTQCPSKYEAPSPSEMYSHQDSSKQSY